MDIILSEPRRASHALLLVASLVELVVMGITSSNGNGSFIRVKR